MAEGEAGERCLGKSGLGLRFKWGETGRASEQVKGKRVISKTNTRRQWEQKTARVCSWVLHAQKKEPHVSEDTNPETRTGIVLGLGLTWGARKTA